MNHGGFDFMFIKDYAGEKQHDNDFIISRDGGFGSLALDRRCIGSFIEKLNDLLSAYKKNYVESGTEWRGYTGSVTGWDINIVYNAQADVVTITVKSYPSTIVGKLTHGDNKVRQKLRCRIDDVPYIIDGLKATRVEYNKFYKD